jgi:hypothetical protein
VATRPEGRTLRAALILALGVSTSCLRDDKEYIERVEVTGATVADNGVLGLTADQVDQTLRALLRADPHFVLLSGDQRAPDKHPPVRLSLELAFTREAQKDGRAGTFAEVGASIAIRRRINDVYIHYEVMGLGEVLEPTDAPTVRARAMQQALRTAVGQAVASTALQLAALEKSDKELLKDVTSPDGRVREFAIRTLSDRKNPGVAEALLEKLKGDDPDEIRRAMGALVELKERRAVPLLIELARGKDMGFLRDILFALAEIGGEEAQAYLFTVAQGHDQPAIREAAQQALDELSARSQRTARDGRGSAGNRGGPAE